MESLKPNFKKRDGLGPVVAQDEATKEILMLAYADEKAYFQTLETGLATYYSTSRKQIWVKGEMSGSTQTVRKVLLNCDGDGDALAYVVRQNGSGACHTGNKTCFSGASDKTKRVPDTVFETDTVF